MKYTPANQSLKTFSELDVETTIDQSFEPRWFQNEAVNAIFDFFYSKTGNPLVVVPTGGGKSHILGMFCKRVLERWPDQRILILSHVDTILRQDYLAIKRHVRANKIGIYSAGVGRKERRAITVAGIQSVYKKTHLFVNSTIILVDEAHSIPPGSEGQYNKFLKFMRCPIVGLTATDFRMRSGYLHQGEGRLFTDIAYTVDLVRLIEEGYLCQLVPKAPAVHVDLEGVKTIAGDFSKKEVAERLNREGVTEAIIEDLVKYKATHKKWLLFTIDIEHCETVTELLIACGIQAVMVHSKMAPGARERVKTEYEAGIHQALVSVESLTTGFDSPDVDLIGLLRATKSPVLHIQMIGRGLRIHPGKDHCLILDYAGNVERLGPINDVQVQKPRKKKGGDPIVKVCPIETCRTICAPAVRICPTCGHAFEFKVKLEARASEKELVRVKKKKPDFIPAERYKVDSVNYQEYVAKSGNLLMLVSYRCNLRTFFEYKSLDPRSKGIHHTRRWWLKHAGTPLPSSVQEAVIRAQAGELRIPAQILVDENDKYPQILSTFL